MKVGLIDVDGHNFPNLATMKISAWHKSKGDMVNWYDPFDHYDIVYCSKVFSSSPDYQYYINADRIVKGGTGYAINGPGGESYCMQKDIPLPYEIEHFFPDYSLYGIKDTAYGFLSRGCPRRCDFCIVSKKEGIVSTKVANLSEFWNGQKNIVLCDPNILACKEWEDLLGQLADSHALIDINQGLDARLLTREKCEAIARLRIRDIHFAWDRYEDKDTIVRRLEMFAEYGVNPHAHKAIVFVLVNHGTTIYQDLERIYTLRAMGYWAYVMVFDKPHASKEHLDIQRWCNNRYVFASCPNFADYKKAEPQDHRQLSFFQ